MLIIFDDQRRECIKNKSGLSKVRPYTGYDEPMVQVADTCLSSQRRAGSQTTGQSQAYSLDDLRSRQSPSRKGVRVLYWKAEYTRQVRNPYIKTWF